MPAVSQPTPKGHCWQGPQRPTEGGRQTVLCWRFRPQGLGCQEWGTHRIPPGLWRWQLVQGFQFPAQLFPTASLNKILKTPLNKNQDVPETPCIFLCVPPTPMSNARKRASRKMGDKKVKSDAVPVLMVPLLWQGTWRIDAELRHPAEPCQLAFGTRCLPYPEMDWSHDSGQGAL